MAGVVEQAVDDYRDRWSAVASTAATLDRAEDDFTAIAMEGAAERSAGMVLAPSRSWDGRHAANVVMACLFLLPALPLLAVIFVLHRILVRDGGPFLYRGARLGRYKKTFNIYKIRTLATHAEQNLGASLCSAECSMFVPMGRFLRSARLDELPQLFNIIKGDMDFIGPRPERKAVYESKIRRHSWGYDARFEVRPGLTGRSQFLTPHSTPKRLRALVDNQTIRKRCGFLSEFLFVMWTAYAVLKKTIAELGLTIVTAVRTVRARRCVADQRSMRRVEGKHVRVFLADEGFRKLNGDHSQLVDMNHEALCLATTRVLQPDQEIRLVMEIRTRRSAGKKRSKCTGIVCGTRPFTIPGNGHHAYVVRYKPISDLNAYLIDQYVLKTAVASSSGTPR
jgi:lipopolysaccharide/colanic/teichoic acid biosynthesis glycosyltransferase